MSDVKDWDKPLDPDERIIWQGRPSSRVQFEYQSLFPVLLDATLLSMLLYALIVGPESQHDNAKFGLGFLLFLFVGKPFWAAVKRSRTSYALTNKRAFIGYRGSLGPEPNSYPITPDTTLELKEGRRNAVWFGASEPKVTLNEGPENDIGFERLVDPHAMYERLQSVQRGTA